MAKYIPLEPNFQQGAGLPNLSSVATGGSLLPATSFIFMMFFAACVVAAGLRIVWGAGLMLPGTPSGLTKAKEVFKKAIFGLLGVSVAYLVIQTINPDLLKGEVDLSALKAKIVGNNDGATGQTNNQNTGQTTSSSCSSKETTISALQSSGGLCGSTQCTLLAPGVCNYQQFLSTIKEASAGVGLDYRVAVVVLCRESHAVVNAINKNTDGSIDCGLMQINSRTGTCSQEMFDPVKNIQAGVSLLKQKLNASGQIYAGIPQIANAMANYNCCSNGDVPSSPSADCTQSSGFPYTIPKWACPINPGGGQFNMCAVKNYACETTKCIESVP